MPAYAMVQMVDTSIAPPAGALHYQRGGRDLPRRQREIVATIAPLRAGESLPGLTPSVTSRIQSAAWPFRLEPARHLQRGD